MAVSASAFGERIIQLLDDMLQGLLRIKVAGEDLHEVAKKLKDELKEELQYLEDAENQVLEEDRARQWLAKLRPVLYKAEQRLETYHRGDAQAKQPSKFELGILRMTTLRYIKQDIMTLLDDIGSVSKERPSMLKSKNEVLDQAYQHNKSCDGQAILCHDNLVGRDIEMKMLTLVDKLTEHHDEQSRHVIIFAIYGPGGVGKTTIARKICDDQRMKSAFSSCLWVSISTGYSVSQILLAIYAAIGDLEVPKTRNNKLQMNLVAKFRGMKIFLVFKIYNGVPSKEGIGNAEIYANLTEVLGVFHAAAEGSRVLIITTDENVFSEMKSAQIQKGAEGYGLQTHRLSQLTVEDGWTLLLGAACLEQAKITPELKKIGIGILKKCYGLPLAIKVVGGILRRKGHSQRDWQDIHDCRAFSLKDPTTGNEGGVRSSIYLSYQHAGPHLKQCFLYLSLFPLDFEIEQHFLTQLWISEGLIDTKHGHSSGETSDGVHQEKSNKHDNREERTQGQRKDTTLSENTPDEHTSASSQAIANESIKSSEQANNQQEIVEDDNNQQPPKVTSGHSSNESLRKQSHCSVQVGSSREKVQEIANRYIEELAERGLIHQENRTKGYKMHEQVRKIAESLTDNEACDGDPKDVARLSTSLYRLSFLNKGLTAIPEEIARFKNLRTLLLSGNPLGEKGLDVICKNLEFLRVLDLSDTEITSIPKTLKNLEKLRHLNLSRTKIKTLPDSIGRLCRLRFLGLERCESLTSLPKSIQKLSKLEYLNLRDTEIREPPRLQDMQGLTFLQGFVVDCTSSNGWLLQELQNMSNLTRLQIKIIKILDRITENGKVLKENDNLRKLELSYCPVNSQTLSEEEASVKKVFAQLQPHQCLESLEIDGYCGSPFPGWLSCSELPYLQQLSLVNCKSCETLPPVWQLQKLKFLRIAGLSKLDKIDMEPRAEMTAFPNLEELQVEYMGDLEYWSEFKAGDLPRLQKFSLTECPKLKHLPGGLDHCKVIPRMELNGAGLQVLENIPVQDLLVEKMQHLTTVSNLPVMKVFTVISCEKLGIVLEVNSLQHIHIVDEHLDQLPKWLEQHVSRIETLDIVGKEELLQRCERSKEYWHIIREIARVYAFYPENPRSKTNPPARRAFFSYTRSNDSFCKHQRLEANAHEDPTPAAPASVDGRGASVPCSSTNPSEGTKSKPAPAQPRQTHRRTTPPRHSVVAGLILSAAMLIGHMGSSHSDRWQIISMLVLYFVALCSLVFYSFIKDRSGDLD